MKHNLYFIVQPKPGFIVVIVRHEPVELFVHILVDILGLHGPQGVFGIYAFVIQVNGAVDEVTVLLYDVLNVRFRYLKKLS